MELFNVNDIYKDFQYPASFLKLVELNLLDFEVWYFMDKESVKDRIKGLQKRYPERNLVPFARRGDCDDIACFEVGKGGQVFIVHDFASSGYEQRKIYENVWEWLKDVIDTMIEFEIMEEME